MLKLSAKSWKTWLMRKSDRNFLMDVILGGATIVAVLSIASYFLFRIFSGHEFLAFVFLAVILGFFIFKSTVRAAVEIIKSPFKRLPFRKKK